MSEETNQSVFWLIKSGGRIIGPMKTDAVAQSLRSKEILPLDEVSQSFGRWHYIRDEKAFELVVNELRNRRSSHEATFTETAALDTTADITERVSAFGPTDKLTANISEQLKEAKSNEREVKSLSDTYDKNESVEVYGYSKDKSFIKSLKPQTNIFIWALLVIVVGGISWKVIFSKGMGGQDTEVLTAKAYFELKIGNPQGAVSYFKELIKQKPTDTALLNDFGGSLLLTHQAAEAKKAFESVLQQTPDNLNKAKALTGLGVAALIDLNLTAAKSQLDEALKVMPDYAAAHANLGVVNLIETKYEDAEKHLIESLDLGATDPIIAWLLAEASYLNAKNSSSVDGFVRARSVLDNIIKSAHFYVQEALALKIHMLMEMKDVGGVEDLATQFLDTDPTLTEDHRKDPFIARDRVNWDSIARYLKQTAGRSGVSPRVAAVYALALFKSSEKIEGKKLIEDIHTRETDDKLIQSVLSFTHMMMGREDEAAAGIVIASEGDQYLLPYILKARLCRNKKDYHCTEEAWRQALKKNEKSISALTGMAWVYIDKGTPQEANKLINKGIDMDPLYIPLVKAELQLRVIP